MCLGALVFAVAVCRRLLHKIKLSGDKVQGAGNAYLFIYRRSNKVPNILELEAS